MNGTDAVGVHGPMETIVTSEVAGRPVAFEAFFEAERVRLLRALYLLTGNEEEAEEVSRSRSSPYGSDGTGSARWTIRPATCTGPR